MKNSHKDTPIGLPNQDVESYSSYNDDLIKL